jgi:hypothetical protein
MYSVKEEASTQAEANAWTNRHTTLHALLFVACKARQKLNGGLKLPLPPLPSKTNKLKLTSVGTLVFSTSQRAGSLFQGKWMATSRRRFRRSKDSQMRGVTPEGLSREWTSDLDWLGFVYFAAEHE